MKQPPFVHSVLHAVNGLGHVLRHERNARIHLCVAAVVTIVAAWLQLDALRWSILALTIGGVWTAEMLNTAIEAVVDLLSPEYHDQARIAKDVAAGAVLLMSLTAIVVGVCILGPPLWSRILPG